MDTYFRSFMDEEGYSPLFFVASYPNVACYGASLADIMTKIRTKEDSPLEIDQENETIRLKEGWEKVTNMFRMCIIRIFYITFF